MGFVFPKACGSAGRIDQIILDGLLEHYEPVFDRDENELPWAEANSEAAVLQGVWISGERIKGQLTPSRMMDNLPIWEEALGLRPFSGQTPSERRSLVETKLRGISGNAQPDVRDLCEAAMGASFVEVSFVSSANTWSYRPGINTDTPAQKCAPGPPGLDWYSNRYRVFVELTRGNLSMDEFNRRVAALSVLMRDTLPSWVDWTWFVQDTGGSGDGFYLDQSLLDYHGL